MDNQTKISVVIPVYNRIKTLESCIQNVVSFEYDNYEIILVNDASTDGSGELCKKYSKTYNSITVINNIKNQGPGLTRNVGLDKASGDYIIFLDSDDKYDRFLLRNVANAVSDKNPDILVYSLWEEYYDSEGNLSYRYAHSLPTCYLNQPRDIHEFVVLLEEETMLGYPWNKAYRLDYLKKNKVRFDDIPHIEDILFNIEAFENIGSLMVLEDKLYHYCNEADNRLTDKYLPDYFKLQKLRIKKFYEQQKRWGSLNSYAMSVMAGEYFRWLLSAVERQVNQDISYNDISLFLVKEFSSRHFAKLSHHLNMSPKLRTLYTPVINRNIKGTIALCRNISTIKRKFPGIFNIAKQNR